MLDIKWILNNPIEADKAFKKRGLKPLSTKLIKMSKSRSEVFVKLENLLKQRNLLSKEIPNTKDESKKKELIKKVKILKDDINKLQEGKTSKNSVLDNFLMELPNFLDKSKKYIENSINLGNSRDIPRVDDIGIVDY